MSRIRTGIMSGMVFMTLPTLYGTAPNKNNTDSTDATDTLNELTRNISSEPNHAQRVKTPPSRQNTTRQRRQPTRDGRPDAGTRTTPKKEPAPGPTTPYDILGLSGTATCAEIKTRYRQMARDHDSSRGRITKTVQEREIDDAAMAAINRAYSELKKKHGCK